jgi:hypothetical protein
VILSIGRLPVAGAEHREKIGEEVDQHGRQYESVGEDAREGRAEGRKEGKRERGRTEACHRERKFVIASAARDLARPRSISG